MAIAADQAERIRGLRDRYGDEATLRAIMKTHTMIDVPYWEQQIEKRGSESAMVDFLGDMGIEPLPRTSVGVALPERLERRTPATTKPATTGWEAIGEVTGPAYPVVRERIADPTVILDNYRKYISVPLTKLGVKQRTAIQRGVAAMRRDMAYLPEVEEAKEIIEARNWKKIRELAIEGRFPTADELGIDYLSEQVTKLQSEYQGARLRGALGVLGYAVNDPSASWFRRGEIPNLVPTEFVAKHPKLALAPLAITAPLEEVAHIATHPERWPGIAVVVLAHKFVVAPASKAGLTWLATKYPKAATYDLLMPFKRFFKGKKITSESVGAFMTGRADIVPEQYPELTPEVRTILSRMTADRKNVDMIAAALRKGKPIRIYVPGGKAAPIVTPTGAPAAAPTEAPVTPPVTTREIVPYTPPVEVPPVPPAEVPAVKEVPPVPEVQQPLTPAVPEVVPPMEVPPAVPPVEEVVAPPPEVVPPPTPETAALEALGYTDSQIRRLRPEAAVRVLGEKIPAGQVSVTSDGDIRLIPDQDMPSEKASAYPYKAVDEQVADVKKDVSDSMAAEIPPGEAGFIRIPALKDFSELSDRFKTGVRTMLEPERDVVTDVYGAIEKWRSESNKAGLYADWSKDLLYRMVSGKKVRLKKAPMLVSKAELEFIPRWIEEPARYAPEFNNLPPEAQAMARALVKDFQDMWEIANKAGILEAWRENYIPHIWRDKESRLRRVLYPMGGRLGRGFRFAKQRKIDTIAKGEELGLHPVLDPVLLNSVYKYQLYRTIANRNLIATLSKMEREDGMPLIMGRPKKPDKLKVWENEYEWVNVPSLARYMYVGEAGDLGMLVKMPAKADPEVAKALNNAFAPWASRSQVNRAYQLARGRIKRVIMFNPAIHGWSIVSDTLDEVNFNPFALVKVMRRGGQLYKNQEVIVEYAVDSGLALQTSYSVAVDLRKELLDSADQLRGILEPLGKLEKWSDRVLWTNIVRNSQLGLFETLTRIMAKRHPDWTRELVGRTTATYVNSLYGTLPHTWMSKGLRETGSILFFARNWTYSNIDLVVKAATLGRKGLGVKALPPAAQTEIGTRYIKHLIKGMAGLLGFAGLTQLAFLVITNKMKEDGIIEGEQVPLHTTFSNEKGHWMDIDTGLDTKTGQRIYLVGPLFRYIRDYIGWATAPLKTFYNKLEPGLKTSIENIANYSVWQRRQITKPGAPTFDAIKQRAKYFVESITPSAVYAKRPGRVKTKFEYFIPFSGTWIRRGAPGGRFTQLFFEFRAEHRYKQDKLEDQIDEALQRGDFAEAMTLMDGRYIDNKAKEDRITRFVSPLNYYYDTASREERLLFLHHLKKYNYTSEDLFNAMAQERTAIENRGD